MLTEKDTIKCESIFNEERTHRFLWKRVWEKDKPLITVIMLNPCHADNIITDTTTALVVNNVARLEEYGGVIITNLYSLVTSKLNFRWNSDEELNHEENDDYIKKAAQESKTVVLAWGKSTDTNQRIAERAEHVIAMLFDMKDKLRWISDGFREAIHPLFPGVRNKWVLVPVTEEDKISIKDSVDKESVLAD